MKVKLIYIIQIVFYSYFIAYPLIVGKINYGFFFPRLHSEFVQKILLLIIFTIALFFIVQALNFYFLLPNRTAISILIVLLLALDYLWISKFNNFNIINIKELVLYIICELAKLSYLLKIWRVE